MICAMDWMLKHIQSRLDASSTKRFDVQTFTWPRHGFWNLIVLVEHQQGSYSRVRWDEMWKFSIIKFLWVRKRLENGKTIKTSLIKWDSNEINFIWWNTQSASFTQTRKIGSRMKLGWSTDSSHDDRIDLRIWFLIRSKWKIMNGKWLLWRRWCEIDGGNLGTGKWNFVAFFCCPRFWFEDSSPTSRIRSDT